MQIGQYEQILIKCQYILTVADSLLKAFDQSSLSTRFRKQKLNNDSYNINNRLIENQFVRNLQYDKNQYQIKQTKVKQRIKAAQHRIKQLKRQIFLQNTSHAQNNKINHLSSKKQRQISKAAQQLNKLSKLLNIQLRNYNTIELGLIEMNQAIQRMDNKQLQLQKKINHLRQRQKLHFTYKQLQENYQKLSTKRQKLLKQCQNLKQSTETSIQTKIKAIDESNKNFQQMTKYSLQLNRLVKQQQFMIQQIKNRQMQNQAQQLSNKVQMIQDDNIFQEEISQLKKTLANRKFNQRVKNIKVDNSVSNSRKVIPEQKQIFKFEIQPVNNFQSVNDYQVQKLKMKNTNPSNPKLQQFVEQNLKKQHSSFDLNTLEVQTLKNIITRKQAQYKKELNYKHSDKNDKARSNTQQIKLSNRKQEHLPNSRFIQQIIDSSNGDKLNHLKNNVRIRTRKSQNQVYQQYEMKKSLQKSRKRYKKQHNQSPKRQVKYTQQALAPQKRQPTPANQPQHKSQLIPQRRSLSTSTSIPISYNPVQSSSPQINSSLSQINLSSPTKEVNRYLTRLSPLTSSKQAAIQKVLEKIRQIKSQSMKAEKKERVAEVNQATLDQLNRQNIQIFKIGLIRKNKGINTSYRKGQSIEIQSEDQYDQGHNSFFDVDEQLNLSRIQQQEQSIRQTNQSTQKMTNQSISSKMK